MTHYMLFGPFFIVASFSITYFVIFFHHSGVSVGGCGPEVVKMVVVVVVVVVMVVQMVVVVVRW